MTTTRGRPIEQQMVLCAHLLASVLRIKSHAAQLSHQVHESVELFGFTVKNLLQILKHVRKACPSIALQPGGDMLESCLAEAKRAVRQLDEVLGDGNDRQDEIDHLQWRITVCKTTLDIVLLFYRIHGICVRAPVRVGSSTQPGEQLGVWTNLIARLGTDPYHVSKKNLNLIDWFSNNVVPSAQPETIKVVDKQLLNEVIRILNSISQLCSRHLEDRLRDLSRETTALAVSISDLALYRRAPYLSEDACRRYCYDSMHLVQIAHMLRANLSATAEELFSNRKSKAETKRKGMVQWIDEVNKHHHAKQQHQTGKHEKLAGGRQDSGSSAHSSSPGWSELTPSSTTALPASTTDDAEPDNPASNSFEPRKHYKSIIKQRLTTAQDLVTSDDYQAALDLLNEIAPDLRENALRRSSSSNNNSNNEEEDQDNDEKAEMLDLHANATILTAQCRLFLRPQSLSAAWPLRSLLRIQPSSTIRSAHRADAHYLLAMTLAGHHNNNNNNNNSASSLAQKTASARHHAEQAVVLSREAYGPRSLSATRCMYGAWMACVLVGDEGGARGWIREIEGAGRTWGETMGILAGMEVLMEARGCERGLGAVRALLGDSRESKSAVRMKTASSSMTAEAAARGGLWDVWHRGGKGAEWDIVLLFLLAGVVVVVMWSYICAFMHSLMTLTLALRG